MSLTSWCQTYAFKCMRNLHRYSLVNCASQEYFKSMRPKLLSNQGIQLYTCVFPGPSVFAKQARGAICRFMVVNRVVGLYTLHSELDPYRS